MRRLVFGIGNSALKMALFDDLEAPVAEVIANGDPRLEEKLEHAIAKAFTDSGAEGSVVCSVVPSRTAQVASALARLGCRPPEVVSPARVDWFGVRYRPVETLGADRLCNAIAARELHGFPAVVVDFGTATTLSVVDENGDFIGGLIAPGIVSGLQSLGRSTAQLPAVEPGRLPDIIADNTTDAMLAGAAWMNWYGAERLIERIRDRFAAPLHVIGTGGAAELFVNMGGGSMLIDRMLTLKGAVVYARRVRVSAERGPGRP